MRIGLLVVGCLALTSFNAGAVEAYQEYRKQVEKAQAIDALKPDLMGEQVSGYDGSTRFEVTDIDLPGNNALPIRLTRSVSIDLVVFAAGAPGFDPSLGGAANWTIDVPHISGTFDASYNWKGTAAGGGAAVVDSRCSRQIWPQVSNGFLLKDVWQGNTVSVPGQGSRVMLMVQAGSTPPMGGAGQNWTTKQQDHFSCLPMRSGLTGEGFLMTDGSGVKYYFDTAVTRTVSTLRASGAPVNALRVKTYLLASKVEDRFGNWVTYTYNGDGQPLRIESSDGRSIVLTYAGGSVLTAVANGRTWSYGYTASAPKTLAAVTLPDGSAWSYQHSNSLHVGGPISDGDNPSCFGEEIAANHNLTITHPSGARGSFDFNNMRHFRSGVPRTYCVTRVSGTQMTFQLQAPYYFDVMSLVAKQLSGPGMPNAQWTYSYGAAYQSLWNGSLTNGPCTTCTQEKTVTTVNPDGTRTLARYGIVFAGNEARELGGSVLDAAGSAMRQHSNTYLSAADAVGQAFPAQWGDGPGSLFKNEAYVRPVIRQETVQDGVVFQSSFNTGCVVAGKLCADAFARPTSQTKGSSLGYSLNEQLTYHDNAAKWVLGQVATRVINGTTVEQVSYDAATAMPLQSWSFGKLQQTLTYHPDGTVATVKDGNHNVTTLGSWHRGVPRAITFADGTTQSALVNDAGWITAVTDQNGFSTGYGYDAMGRLASIVYPASDSVAWHNVSLHFQQVGNNEHGLPAGHWRHSRYEGNKHVNVYYDAMWRPVLEEQLDHADIGSTLSQVVKQYDANGRLVFQSFPQRGIGNYWEATQGIHTEYDALGRVTSVSQDSEHGLLTTLTEYLSDANGAFTRVTDPKGNQTRTWYQMFDQPSYDAPLRIEHPEGAVTRIQRDVFGKPQEIWRR